MKTAGWKLKLLNRGANAATKNQSMSRRGFLKRIGRSVAAEAPVGKAVSAIRNAGVAGAGAAAAKKVAPQVGQKVMSRRGFMDRMAEAGVGASLGVTALRSKAPKPKPKSYTTVGNTANKVLNAARVAAGGDSHASNVAGDVAKGVLKGDARGGVANAVKRTASRPGNVANAALWSQHPSRFWKPQ